MMLMTGLTLPSKAGEGNQAVCGSLRQFRAVDAQSESRRKKCNLDVLK